MEVPKQIKLTVVGNEHLSDTFVLRVPVLMDNEEIIFADFDALRGLIVDKVAQVIPNMYSHTVEVAEDAEFKNVLKCAENYLSFLKKETKAKLKLFARFHEVEHKEEAPVVHPALSPAPVPVVDLSQELAKVQSQFEEVSRERDSLKQRICILEQEKQELHKQSKESNLHPDQAIRSLHEEIGKLQFAVASIQQNFSQIQQESKNSSRTTSDSVKKLSDQVTILDGRVEKLYTNGYSIQASIDKQSDSIQDRSRVSKEESRALQAHVSSQTADVLKAVDSLKSHFNKSIEGLESKFSTIIAQALREQEVRMMAKFETMMINTKTATLALPESKLPSEDDSELEIVDDFVPDSKAKLSESMMMFSEQLTSLEKMGFDLVSLNTMLLKSNNGDLHKVVKELEKLGYRKRN